MKPYELHRGSNIELLRGMASNSVDSIVTDPPYELGFMGKTWDSKGIAFNVEMWRECLRVLKPGGYLLAFGGTRTFHRMACAIEDAGFELRDTIMWVYGSGFPKSLDVSKAIDGTLTAGRSDSLALRDVNETRPGEATVRPTSTNGHRGIVGSGDAGPSVKRKEAATEAARQWQGWGTALKPALEPITMARKPLVGTVAANVLAHGTGALNIDGCRVLVDGEERAPITSKGGLPVRHTEHAPREGGVVAQPHELGRWPANLIHDGSDEVLAAFPKASGALAPVRGTEPSGKKDSTFGEFAGRAPSDQRDGGGSAARFFYCAKASRADRNEGCEELPAKALNWSSGEANPGSFQSANTDRTARNHHPTVKPTELMRYLVRLVTPAGGNVLDVFNGSGSTGKAAVLEGMRYIGLELDEDADGKPIGYIAISEARIEAAWRSRQAALSAPPSAKRPPKPAPPPGTKGYTPDLFA